jgi:radical SAM superfamily enzyme YgiQ (UPF0313 family)
MSDCIIIGDGVGHAEDFSRIQRSLGAYRVASELIEKGYSTFVFDFINEFTLKEIFDVLDKHLNEKTLWVGFSSTFFWPIGYQEDLQNVLNNKIEHEHSSLNLMYWKNYTFVKNIIEYIKSKSKAKIVYGGAKTPYTLIDKNVDYYVLGYADVTILELTDFLAGKKQSIEHIEEVEIDGVKKYKIDSFKYAEPRMDSISTSWWRKEFNILPAESLPIETGRGCIFKCKFCSFPLLGKKKGTYTRSCGIIREELIKTFETTGTTSFYITDDTFNDDNDKMEEFHKMFTSLPFKPKLTGYLRLDLINKYTHQADLLSEMGFVGAFFGIETLQPESAKSIGKGLHPNKVKDRLYWLAEKWKNKINVTSGFILGLPYDTTDYFDELFNWSLEDDNPLQEIIFYPLKLFNNKTNKELDRYNSEFAINPEIYGYEFNTITDWRLPSQKLDYNMCKNIAEYYNNIRGPKNKISSFTMHTMANLGVSYDDMYKCTQNELLNRYNFEELNRLKIEEYKGLILNV